MKRATKENVERIKEKAKRTTKEEGMVNGFSVIAGACTALAGTENERTFTESQLKELFEAVTRT